MPCGPKPRRLRTGEGAEECAGGAVPRGASCRPRARLFLEPRVPRDRLDSRAARPSSLFVYIASLTSQGRTGTRNSGASGYVYTCHVFIPPRRIYNGFSFFPHASRSRLRLFPQGSRAWRYLGLSPREPTEYVQKFRTGQGSGLCASHLGSSPPRHVWPCNGYIPCRCRLQPSSRGPLGAVLGSRLWLMRTSHFECSRLDAHPSATVVVDRVDRAGDRHRRRPLDGRLLGWAAQRLPPWRWCIRSGGLSDETSHLGVRYASRSDLAPRIDAKTELRRRRWQWRRWHCTRWQRRPWHCPRWQRRRWHCPRCCSAAGAMLWARLPLRFRLLTIAAEKFAGHAELILVNHALSRPHARSRWCWTGALQPAPRGRRGRHHAHFPGQPADKRAAECDGYFVRSARCGFSISSSGFRIWLSPTWCMGCE